MIDLNQDLIKEVDTFCKAYDTLYGQDHKKRMEILITLSSELALNRTQIEMQKKNDLLLYYKFCDLLNFVEIALIEFNKSPRTVLSNLEMITNMRNEENLKEGVCPKNDGIQLTRIQDFLKDYFSKSHSDRNIIEGIPGNYKTYGSQKSVNDSRRELEEVVSASSKKLTQKHYKETTLATLGHYLSMGALAFACGVAIIGSLGSIAVNSSLKYLERKKRRKNNLKIN